MAHETALVYAGTAGQYTNGQEVCFAASSTALSFSSKTLSNPIQNTVVSTPYSAYKFTDASLGYELVFNNGVLYEINVMNGTTLEGQFAPAGSNSGSNSDTGTGSLTVETTLAGMTTSALIQGVAKPSSQADFCGGIETDSSLTALASAGGSLTINNCSFSGSVGNIADKVTITSPVNFSTDYTVRHTYNQSGWC